MDVNKKYLKALTGDPTVDLIPDDINVELPGGHANKITMSAYMVPYVDGLYDIITQITGCRNPQDYKDKKCRCATKGYSVRFNAIRPEASIVYKDGRTKLSVSVNHSTITVFQKEYLKYAIEYAKKFKIKTIHPFYITETTEKYGYNWL